jgi:hypothetical protein
MHKTCPADCCPRAGFASESLSPALHAEPADEASAGRAFRSMVTETLAEALVPDQPPPPRQPVIASQRASQLPRAPRLHGRALCFFTHAPAEMPRRGASDRNQTNSTHTSREHPSEA